MGIGAAGSRALAAGSGSVDAGAAAAAAPDQPIRIPLEPMGFQSVLQDFLLAGATGLTVDFADNDHLLVTFNTKHLMKRDPNEQPGDDDRTVEAVLVELPSGKALARTEWRMHDRLQYLWDLGHGRFLLRVRDRLTMLAPLDRLQSGDAFRGTPVLDAGDRHIVALLVSSDKDLLTLETMRRVNGPPGTASDVTFEGSDQGGPVQINFYRLNNSPSGFMAEAAGVVRAPAPLDVPMTRAGLLDIVDGGKNRWLFNFNEHAGKVDELAEWDTTCFPHATFVGHGEFVAFGCRGSEGKPEIAGFNMNGAEMWEQGLYDSYVSPSFGFAPAAGRFALERTLVGAPMDQDASLSSGAVEGQEVRVYQAYSGKIILKVSDTPVQRAGGNFALSPDGTRLAVFEQTVRQRTTKLGDPYADTATSVVVYPLPAASDQDRKDIAEMEAKAPVDTDARIDASLARMAAEDSQRVAAQRGPTKMEPQVAAMAAGVLGSPAAKGGTADVASPATGANQEPGNPAMQGQLPNAPGKGAPPGGGSGDADDGSPAGPRKPPTLYEPGETPQPATQGKGKQ
jgi:hypothetical protein